MIVEGFYRLLALIDYLIFKLVSTLISVNIDIAGVEIFTADRVNEIANRIYVVIGVVMLFKLVISAIQFMVNPDGFDDKEKGLAGIIKKTIISLALMVLMPALFDFMMAMQSTIIKTIPKIVFGNQAGTYISSDGSANSSIDNTSDKMAFTVLSSFITANKNNPGGSVGEDSSNAIHDLETFRDRAADGCNDGIVGNAGKCNYNYMIVISTLCGGFLCYVLLSMTLDVAIRAIKFSIIRMLAPIPISSYIFSKEKLTTFFKTVMSVYFDLFIRLAIIFLIIFGVKEITVSTPGSPNLLQRIAGKDASWFRNAIVTIAIIGGLFLFAKNAPKFITDLLGIKDIGTGDMKDMFKSPWQRVGGLSAPGAAIGAYRNAREYGESKGKALRRAFTTGAHATGARLKDIASGKSLSESYKSSKEAAMARTKRNLEYANRYPKRRERERQIWQERWDKYTGVTTGGKRASAQIEAANRALKARSNAWNRAQSKVVENASAYNGGTITDSAGNVLTYSDMYALFEKDAPEMYAGQKRELASSYQKMKDVASTDFLRQSFAGVATGNGDGQSRNVFAEDVFSIARSGADKDTVAKLLNKSVTVSSGATVQVNAIDAAERINKMNQLRDEGVPLTDPRWSGLQFSSDEAEALAMFARDLNKTAGTVRLEATKTQTTVPKES